MNTRRTTKIITAAAIAGLLSVACSDKAMEPFQDAGREGPVDKTPAKVLAFPDGFSNVAHKCDGPNMVYVAFKGDANRAALAVVKDDPRCSTSPSRD